LTTETSYWPRKEKDRFFVEPYDPANLPFDDDGNIDFAAWIKMPAPIQRPLLPFIQPDPPRLTPSHFPKPPGWNWRRAEHLIGPNFWRGTPIVLSWYGTTTLSCYREEGDYVVLVGAFRQEAKFHKYAWVECP
jgi:hypothetical protein